MLSTCGGGAVVKLFGSRLDDHKKGGDIDLLLILPGEQSMSEIFQIKISFLTALEQKIGEQKVDLLIRHKGNENIPVFKEAMQKGVELW